MLSGITLLVGIIIGWIIEWMIDWVYWQNRDTIKSNNMSAASASLPSMSQNIALEEKIAELQSALEASQLDNEELRRQLVTLPLPEVPAMAATTKNIENTQTIEKDDLTRIVWNRAYL